MFTSPSLRNVRVQFLSLPQHCTDLYTSNVSPSFGSAGFPSASTVMWRFASSGNPSTFASPVLNLNVYQLFPSPYVSWRSSKLSPAFLWNALSYTLASWTAFTIKRFSNVICVPLVKVNVDGSGSRTSLLERTIDKTWYELSVVS